MLHLAGERIVGRAHVGEHRAALRGGHFLGVQDRQARRLVLVRRVGVPVGGALDAEPVDLAVLVDVRQPRHFGVLGVAVVDQRVKLRLAEAPPECRQLTGSEVLLAEDQDRMVREGLLDPR